jgi:hypothetical protein
MKSFDLRFEHCASQRKPHFEPPPSTDWGLTLQYLDLSSPSSDPGLKLRVFQNNCETTSSLNIET